MYLYIKFAPACLILLNIATGPVIVDPGKQTSLAVSLPTLAILSANILTSNP